MGTDPLIEAIEARMMNAASAHPAEFFGADEAGVFENLKMLADCGEGDAQPFSEARDGGGCGADAVEDRAARGIAQGMEKLVDAGFIFLQAIPFCASIPASVCATMRRSTRR
jgi:hypothetical protein